MVVRESLMVQIGKFYNSSDETLWSKLSRDSQLYLKTMKGEKDKTPFPKITLLDYRLKFLLPLVD